MFTLTQIKSHLIGMGHGGTLNKVRNIESMFERSAAKLFLKCKTLEMMRVGALTNTIHDDVYNYALPSDFGALIDLFPQDERNMWDRAVRNNVGQFDLEKATKNRTVSIEGMEGTKVIRINWRTRKGKVFHTMNSVTDNGTWSVVGSATGLEADTINKVSGSGSIKFTHVASGDGIQNTTASSLDLTDEDGVADVFIPVFLSVVPTSLTPVWGNDLTTKYWTGVAQTTQADGRAFQIGWNLIKASWSAATQTGTVDPATIDSFKITAAGTALGVMRVDNIIFSIGRNFDIKYYSKYLYKNAAGTYISQPASDDDYVLVDNDSLPLYLFECLKDMAHQMEGSDSAFDINFAEAELKVLFPNYRSLYPAQAQKAVARGGSLPGRGRWGGSARR